MTDAPAFELLLSSGEGGGDEALAESAELPGKDALAAMRRAAQAHPEDPDYWFMLGGALAHRGEHEAATGAFREALRFPTAEPAYRRSLGCSFWRLGRFEEARQAFDEALRDHPEDAEAANGLALSLLRLARPAEAVALLRRITAGEPRASRLALEPGPPAGRRARRRRPSALFGPRSARSHASPPSSATSASPCSRAASRAEPRPASARRSASIRPTPRA